jgi:hypothetical protein
MALSKFGSAFAEARKAGEKEFTFNGKKYTTDMADSKPTSVGGTPKAGEYKTRAAYSDRGNEATEKNSMRRDMYDRMKEIDQETQGDAMAMRNKPRRTPEPLTETNKPGTSTRYENADATSETFKKGGKVSSASKRADGIAQRGKTRA